MSNTALKVEKAVTEKELLDYLDTFGSTGALLPTEKIQFLNMAKAYGLNPFKREIYATAYGEGKYRKCSIVTGYEVYLKRAERTNLLDGWEVTFAGAGNNLTCRITIWRKDWGKPFCHEVYYNESVQLTHDGRPNAVWAKMPRTMLRKVAIGQGFRLCFSDELGGMPYTSDEPNEGRNVTEPPPLSDPAEPDFAAERRLQAAEPDFAAERKQLLMSIKELLRTKNPDELPYFDEHAVKRWGDRVRELPRDASSIPGLRGIADLVKARLEALKAAYEPLPFEDEPATSGVMAAKAASIEEVSRPEQDTEADDMNNIPSPEEDHRICGSPRAEFAERQHNPF